MRPQGLYCPAGDFYIDPIRGVERAVVTHGHSDHCARGHQSMLATAPTGAIARARHGKSAYGTFQAAELGEVIRIGDAQIRFMPAGHVIGSAQIVIETGGARVVISGDYKRAPDPTCTAFEPVICDLFVTEATFGLPVYRHPPLRGELQKIFASQQTFPNRAHVLGVYSLGKAQRIMGELLACGYDRPVYLHHSLIPMTQIYQNFDVPLIPWEPVADMPTDALRGQIVLAPPSAVQEPWARFLPEPLAVGVSGWMQVRGRAQSRQVELPLIVSDHCDWDALCQTVRQVQAETIWVTHGAEDALVHWCQGHGLNAAPLRIAGRRVVQ